MHHQLPPLGENKHPHRPPAAQGVTPGPNQLHAVDGAKPVQVVGGGRGGGGRLLGRFLIVDMEFEPVQSCTYHQQRPDIKEREQLRLVGRLPAKRKQPHSIQLLCRHAAQERYGRGGTGAACQTDERGGRGGGGGWGPPEQHAAAAVARGQDGGGVRGKPCRRGNSPRSVGVGEHQPLLRAVAWQTTYDKRMLLFVPRVPHGDALAGAGCQEHGAFHAAVGDQCGHRRLQAKLGGRDAIRGQAGGSDGGARLPRGACGAEEAGDADASGCAAEGEKGVADDDGGGGDGVGVLQGGDHAAVLEADELDVAGLGEPERGTGKRQRLQRACRRWGACDAGVHAGLADDLDVAGAGADLR